MSLTIGSINLRDAPQSVSQVTKDAQDYEYNALVPLKYWLRSAAAMIRQVGYLRDTDEHIGTDKRLG